jgi:prepilin peptidase CpaA
MGRPCQASFVPRRASARCPISVDIRLLRMARSASAATRWGLAARRAARFSLLETPEIPVPQRRCAVARLLLPERPMSIFLLLAFGVCLLAAITDLRRATIPNALTYPVITLAPLLHVAFALHARSRASFALLEGGYSLLGIVSCGALPYLMWRKQALGGGDLKLFAALGALLLPRLSFQVELYVFSIGVLIACAQMAYRGRLFATVFSGLCALIPARCRSENSSRLEPALVSWFRLGPCFAFGVLWHLLMNWKGF